MRPLPHSAAIRYAVRVTALALCCLPAPLAAAQDDAPPPELTSAGIQAAMQQVRDDVTLDEAARTAALEIYSEAMAALEETQAWRERLAEYETALEAGPVLVSDLEASIEEGASLPPRVPVDADLSTVEQAIATAEARESAVRERMTELEAALDSLGPRRRQLPELIAAATQQAVELAELPPPAQDAPAVVTEARAVRHRALRQAAEAEMAALEAELSSLDVRSDIMRLEREQSQQELRAWERRLQSLRAQAARLRAEAAEREAQAASEALMQAADVPAELRSYVEELAGAIKDRAEERERAAGRLAGAQAELVEARRDTAEVSRAYASVLRRVEVAGLSNATGQLLLDYRSQLRDWSHYAADVRDRRERIAEVELRLLDLRDLRDSLGNTSEELSTLMQQLPAGADEAVLEEIRAFLRDLVSRERTQLEALLDDYRALSQLLLDVQTVEQQLVQTLDEFEAFVDERVLWVRSTESLSTQDIGAIAGAARALASLEMMQDLVMRYMRDARSYPLLYAFAVLAFVLLLAARPRLYRARTAAGEEACTRTCTSFRPTWRALVYTVALSAPVPLLLAFAGWRLGATMPSDDATRDAGTLLIEVAFLVAVLVFLRQVIREGSLAEQHFGWPAPPLAAMRWRLLMFLWILIPIALLSCGLTIAEVSGFERAAADRLFFVAGMGALGWFAHTTLWPGNRLLAQAQPQTPVRRLRRRANGLYLVATGAPLVLIVAALSGYLFTAQRIGTHFFYTTLMILLLLLVYAMVSRALFVMRRGLAIQQAREMQEAEAEKGNVDVYYSEVPDVEPETLDLASLDAQNKRLLAIVLAAVAVVFAFYLWQDELPAANFLNQFELWNTTTTETVTETTPEGETQTVTRERVVPVTLWHLGLGLVILVGTFVAARNMAAILEITLLRAFDMLPGERTAVISLVRYAVGIIGIAVVLSVVGFSWERVQWLVAALGVGLGFGLQEIVANFTSGLVLLFEQPIRVGDTVTIGNVSGRVTKIRIRATTILDWDRKELVVPNKEFISGQLINWSLSDEVLRITIPVGVAYGSDTNRVIAVLGRVAHEHPLVLEDPAPLILFMAFGDSALQFEARVYIPSVDAWLQVLHEMHMAIDEGFRKAGIEIAFPQRDLHIRSFRAAVPIAPDRARAEDAAVKEEAGAWPGEA